MKLEDINRVAVLGAGIMGHGIAQSFLMGGYPVRLYDVGQSILDRAESFIEKNLENFARHGLIESSEVEACMKRLTTTLDLRTCVEGAQFVTEAAPEDLGLKQNLFGEVEGYVEDDAILATNTSSLTLKEIGEKVAKKDRLIITHWFNPPHIVPAVEIVMGPETSEEIGDLTYALFSKLRKLPVKLRREVPGFIVNRIQMALIREVLSLYEQGIAGAEDIDRAVRGSIGFRLASIGPLETVDMGGVSLWLRVCRNLFPLIDRRTEPPEVLERLASEGYDGIKSGKGFYDYSADYSGGSFDDAVKRRDSEFLNRLKNLYWGKTTRV